MKKAFSFELSAWETEKTLYSTRLYNDIKDLLFTVNLPEWLYEEAENFEGFTFDEDDDDDHIILELDEILVVLIFGLL